MEVHAHTHTARKKWYHYFWEFFMLFLAVSLGFLVENLREHISDRHREKEFARTLYAELHDDSIVAANKIRIRLEKEKDMDYVSGYLKDSTLTSLPHDFYPALATVCYLINTYAFEPKDGILSQLRNSGSLRYFKSIVLQKLLGDLSVAINNIRERNDQEYQFFASPLKLFLLQHFDFGWLDQLRKKSTATNVLELINAYRKNDAIIDSKILDLPNLQRNEAVNMILFYKQMLVSTRTLQLNAYISTNHRILEVLRSSYSLEEN